MFVSMAQLFSLVPGKIGIFTRNAFYSLCLVECGDDVSIGFGTIFSHYDVKIGTGVYIGANCTIGIVTIGDGTMIGSNVDILSGQKQHRRDDNGRLLGSEHGIFQRLHVGRNSWIGNSSVILADVGENCTIGAGSVVTKPVESDSTVVGNPAKPIGN